MRPRLVVAALSARVLAEAARAAGYDPLALDAFGDRDTRAAALDWRPIGDGLHIDRERLCAALAAVGDGAVGWVAGAGCEPHLAAACAAAPGLPLLGNPPAVAGAVRQPGRFFAALAGLGIEHPPTSLQPPADARGWLVKDFGGSGGWQVRRASRARPSEEPQTYWQRELRGEPLSALFVADGCAARVVGMQRQLVRARAGRPFVFHGLIGPVALDPALREAIGECVARLAAHFALRGLNGADFLLGADGLRLLEVNPRPTAAIALYEPGELLRAHLEGCAGRLGALPAAPPALRGFEIAFAERACTAGAPLASWCRDLPAAGARFAPNDPVCTVTAEHADETALRALLRQRRDDLLASLETA